MRRLGAALAEFATRYGVSDSLYQLGHPEGLAEQLEPMFVGECHAIVAA